MHCRWPHQGVCAQITTSFVNLQIDVVLLRQTETNHFHSKPETLLSKRFLQLCEPGEQEAADVAGLTGGGTLGSLPGSEKKKRARAVLQL